MARIDHIAIEVSNMDTSCDFYVSVLGFMLTSRAVNEDEHEEYSFLELEGFHLELIRDQKKTYDRTAMPAKPYCPHIVFGTDDMTKTVEELTPMGVTIIAGPLEIENEETWVYFIDPDGNVPEYIQWY